MDGGEKEERPRESVDVSKLARQAGIFAALGVILGFVYTVTHDGLPRSPGNIVLADSLFIVLLTAFILFVNHHMATEGRRTYLHRVRSLSLFAVVTFAVVAGVLAGLANPTEEVASAGWSSAYAKQLRKEIQRLRKAGGLAHANGSDTRKAYSQEAQGLGELYGKVSVNLRTLEVSAGDRAAHLRLVERLAVVSQAYEHLGMVAAERSVTTAEIDTARDRVQAAIREVRAAEEGLERHGYRIVFMSN
jgi:hypothetical protein